MSITAMRTLALTLALIGLIGSFTRPAGFSGATLATLAALALWAYTFRAEEKNND